jgi:hypothetical protein
MEDLKKMLQNFTLQKFYWELNVYTKIKLFIETLNQKIVY